MAQQPGTTAATTKPKTASAKAKEAAEKAKLAAEEARIAEEEAKQAALAEQEATQGETQYQEPSTEELVVESVKRTLVVNDTPAPEVTETVLTGQTLAEAQQRQLDDNVLLNPVAKSIAELTKHDAGFKEATKDLGNGVSLVAKANHPAMKEGARVETLERFIVAKYGLEPEDYSDTLKRTIRGFEQYHMNMNSRAPVTLEEAAKHQSAWFRVVAGALDSQIGDSAMCFDVILYLANQHEDDLFNARLACRAFNLLSDVQRDQFNLFQTVILGAANPRTRSRYVKTQLNIDAVGKQVRSANQRRNLLAYLASID